MTHHYETHKKTLENGNLIAKEYDYLKDIYQEVERTKDNELVREIILVFLALSILSSITNRLLNQQTMKIPN
ncbi:hypothetical protein [Helicobacter pylori]|uniref:hypothetical protein n=1 Tax=Helicobacter pylori TaxID=210 RepID=UPI000B3276ED|nr:hypothetical protein [Helicobacter pylori]